VQNLSYLGVTPRGARRGDAVKTVKT